MRRESLVQAIVMATGWVWCENHGDFFDGGQGEWGQHVGLTPTVLDAIVAWAEGGDLLATTILSKIAGEASYATDNWVVLDAAFPATDDEVAFLRTLSGQDGGQA